MDYHLIFHSFFHYHIKVHTFTYKSPYLFLLKSVPLCGKIYAFIELLNINVL